VRIVEAGEEGDRVGDAVDAEVQGAEPLEREGDVR